MSTSASKPDFQPYLALSIFKSRMEALQAVDELKRTVYENPWIPSDPHPKQVIFLLHNKFREGMYGGAAGGSKTETLLIAAAQYLDVPGYSALILRESFPALSQPDGLIPRSKEWWYDKAKYHEQSHTWTFPSGATLTFGYLDSDNSVYQYQGGGYHFLGIDELTQHCLTPEHEVLTEGGWKPIASIQKGERVMSLAPDYSMGLAEVTETWRYDYDGELVSIRSSAIRADVTPNHRMVIEGQKNRQWRFCEAKDLPAYPRFARSGKWLGKERDWVSIPQVSGRGIGENANQADGLRCDDYLELLGWYLSEGSSFCMGVRSGNPKSPVVSIRQTKSQPTLIALMARIPWRSTYKEGEGYHVFSRQLYEHLKPMGGTYTKRVPRWILGLSKRQLQIFFDSFALGDGSRRKHGGVTIALANEGLVDDIWEIAIRLGHAASKRETMVGCGKDRTKRYRQWVLYVNKLKRSGRTSVEAQPKHVARRHYVGPVHCLTVEPHHTFLVRKDGRVFWSGNSKFRYTYLASRMRKKKYRLVQGVPIRLRSATNPGGAEMAWVKERFIPEGYLKSPPEIQFGRPWYMPGDELEDGSTPEDRFFVPARRQDNPHLDQQDYGRSMAMLDPITRAQLDHGDWNARADGRFKYEWFQDENAHYWWQESNLPDRWFVNRENNKGWQRIDLSIFTIVDLAASKKTSADYTVFGTFAKTPDNDLLVLDIERKRIAIEDIVPALHRHCEKWSPSWVGVEAVAFQSLLAREAQRRPGMPAVRELFTHSKGKLERATPAIIRAESRQIVLPRKAPWRDQFLGELTAFTGDDKSGHDDQTDVLAYAAIEMAGARLDTPPKSMSSPPRPAFSLNRLYGRTGRSPFKRR